MNHEPGESGSPGDRRVGRQLDRPPSDRYGAVVAAEAPTVGSLVRGIAFGSVAALFGTAAIVLLGGLFAITAGLLVVAAVMGYGVAAAMTSGKGTSRTRSARRRSAAALAGAGAILGQVGLWLFARAEGGVLSLPDYLGEVFGPLVPLQLLLAAGVAWWSTR